jgi:hypothetical protein
MPRRRLAACIFAFLAPFAFTGCSDQSPIAPNAGPDGGQNVTTQAELVAGTYLLTVYATSVGRGAVLDAYVRDASGNPATSGTAVFYYCSRQGVPAPRGACLTGSGNWVRYGSAGIIPTGTKKGHALMAYTEAPPSGTTIGFRFRYTRGSTIASGYSNSVNYTWP